MALNWLYRWRRWYYNLCAHRDIRGVNMIQGCLNWNNKDALYIQDNNVFEILDQGLNWCNTTMDTIAWASLTPNFDEWKNPFGGSWRIQPEDYIAAYYRSPANYPKFKLIRNLDLSVYPPEQVPQYHPIAMLETFGIIAMFSWGGSFELLASLLSKGHALGLCLKKPGHFICAVAYDDEKKLIGFKDPWSGNTWPEGFSQVDDSGNKWFTVKDFTDNVEPYYILFRKRD